LVIDIPLSISNCSVVLRRMPLGIKLKDQWPPQHMKKGVYLVMASE
jgi:hypothetical protein